MKKLIIILIIAQTIIYAQDSIIIDGNFDDWQNVPVSVTDPADDVHDTEGYNIGGQPSEFIDYSDVDLLEVKFANDGENLYGYMKATGTIGRTSSEAEGHSKMGRYYFIFTIDVDENDTTGYPLREGGYYPDSKGFDMNMEVEFYDGAFNTGHYLNHEFLSRYQLNTQGSEDLANGIVRLAPGTYKYYSQWVMFEDSTYVEVVDKGPVYQGIIEIAVSEDGHEAEMKAPFWGFLKTPEGVPIIDVDRHIIVSASLEASGELSEAAADAGYEPGSNSYWGSDTAEPFRYFVANPLTPITAEDSDGNLPENITLYQNYPNPFNPSTRINFSLSKSEFVNISVYNLMGEKIEELVSRNLGAGNHSVELKGSNLSSGIYYYRITTQSYSKTKKMTLVK